MKRSISKISGVSRILAALALGVVGASVVPTRAAQACGGCFSPTPPPGAVFSVTDHRMVLSMSGQQTTLWDQFSYSGNPSEFAWILPIRSGPTVRVELADDQFLSLMESVSAPVLSGVPSQASRDCGYCIPPRQSYGQCPGSPPANYGYADSSVGSWADAAAPSADVPGVVVHREEVVGPYQVTTIGGGDAMAIRTWLSMNGYNVPASIEPVLMNYVNMHMDFVAVRLRGTEGLRRMKPLKITMPGLQPVLPLQMVAAGVSDKVGLALMVIADSRYEAQNFPNFRVRDEDLTYDFNAPRRAEEEFRAASRRLDVMAGGGWQTETSRQVDGSLLSFSAQRIPPSPPGMDGTSTSAADDVRTALTGLGGNVVITRLRAELPASALTRDLLLRASIEEPFGNNYSFGTVLNAQTPPVCAPLQCMPNWGRYETDGYIRDPFGQIVAPGTVFPARYTRGSVPPHQPVIRNVEPGVLPPIQPVCPGVAHPGVGGGGCAVHYPTSGTNTAGTCALVALALCLTVKVRKRSRS